MTWRAWVLVAVITATGLAASAYFLLAPAASTPAARAASAPDPDTPRLPSPPGAPYVMVRSMVADDSFNRIALVPLDTPNGPRFVTSLSCERVFYAGGRGVCLTIGLAGMTTTYAAEIFDEQFASVGRVPLTGMPSRVRVSPDGRLAGITVFETGHSYAESGYSTRTTIVDTASARILDHLEAFAVTRNGVAFRAVDFNFWGVTFARDSNRFYATLASGGVKHLVEGDVKARTARVLATDVECPSLSPDNTRVAYKKAFTDERGIGWHLQVLDLRTMAATSLDAETRSVDDQVDWLDDEHVIYHLPGSRGADIWMLSTSAPEPPRVLVPLAYSPAVVR
jgi:hypothetical protein